MSAIKIEGVSKQYVKLEEQAMLLRALLPFNKPKRSPLWALRDIDLEVGEGETLGVLGRNGAGKTTLLRLLAGVTRPTTGRVTIRGRIAPLISVGVGFNREMSGRENVFVNGMLLGLTEDEIRSRFDDIVEFAELQEFIDVPVKFYSTGMYMRLGFSVAIHVDPQVLLVDEVLAVGDLTFQLKCVERMQQLRASGMTIVLVSHAPSAVRMLCPRAVVMRRGEIVFDGDSAAAVVRHQELLTDQVEEHRERHEVAHTGGVTVLDRRLEGSGGEVSSLRQHDEVHLRLRLRFDEPVESPQVSLTVMTDTGNLAYQLLPPFGTAYGDVTAGEVVDADITFFNRLAGGAYTLNVAVLSNDGRRILYQDPVGLPIFVDQRGGGIGVAELDAVVELGGVRISEHRDLRLGDPTA